MLPSSMRMLIMSLAVIQSVRLSLQGPMCHKQLMRAFSYTCGLRARRAAEDDTRFWKRMPQTDQFWKRAELEGHSRRSGDSDEAFWKRSDVSNELIQQKVPPFYAELGLDEAVHDNTVDYLDAGDEHFWIHHFSSVPGKELQHLERLLRETKNKKSLADAKKTYSEDKKTYPEDKKTYSEDKKTYSEDKFWKRSDDMAGFWKRADGGTQFWKREDGESTDGKNTHQFWKRGKTTSKGGSDALAFWKRMAPRSSDNFWKRDKDQEENDSSNKFWKREDSYNTKLPKFWKRNELGDEGFWKRNSKNTGGDDAENEVSAKLDSTGRADKKVGENMKMFWKRQSADEDGSDLVVSREARSEDGVDARSIVKRMLDLCCAFDCPHHVLIYICSISIF